MPRSLAASRRFGTSAVGLRWPASSVSLWRLTQITGISGDSHYDEGALVTGILSIRHKELRLVGIPHVIDPGIADDSDDLPRDNRFVRMFELWRKVLTDRIFIRKIFPRESLIDDRDR